MESKESKLQQARPQPSAASVRQQIAEASNTFLRSLREADEKITKRYREIWDDCQKDMKSRAEETDKRCDGAMSEYMKAVRDARPTPEGMKTVEDEAWKLRSRHEEIGFELQQTRHAMDTAYHKAMIELQKESERLQNDAVTAYIRSLGEAWSRLDSEKLTPDVLCSIGYAALWSAQFSIPTQSRQPQSR